MGRQLIILAFWLVGFFLGFFGYLVSPNVSTFLLKFLPQLFVSEFVVGAFLSGIAGGIITVVVIIMWSYLSR